MVSCVKVRFIDESDFVNKGNGFTLRDCSDWELDSSISLELTDLLDDISIFLGGTEVGGERSLSQKFQFRYWNLGRKKKQQQKANGGVEIIVAKKKTRQPNVNSREATSTHRSKENAKMQANHSRNQNRKAAEVLLKGLENKLRPMC